MIRKNKNLKEYIISKLSKERIYFYLFFLFIVVYLLLLVYIIHKGRYFLSTEINQYHQVYYKKQDIIEQDFEIKKIKNIIDQSKIINGYEVGKDSSITKFVNNKISFNNLSYSPNLLVNIGSEFVIDSKGNSLLRSEANEALQKLSKDFFEYFGEKIVVVSAFRSYNYQVGIKKGGCSDMFCAKAGFSEHQTGLAVDLWEATSQKEFLANSKLVKYFAWLNKNAYKYGFHNTYQKGLNVDGYNIEPWHWRYLGIDLAKELYDSNLTFAEYYDINK